MTKVGNVGVTDDYDFAEALRRGDLTIVNDTVWFARAYDGRIIGLPIDGGTELSFLPPLYLEPDRPVSYSVDAPRGREVFLPVRITSQLGAFTLDPWRNFIFEQHISASTRLLVFGEAEGKRYLPFDIGTAEIYSLAATHNAVYAIVADPNEPDRTLIQAFPNPLARTYDADPASRCTE